MKKTAIVLIVITILFLLVIFIPRPGAEEKSAVLSEDRQSFQVLKKDGQVVLNYSINDWRDWAEENWEIILSEPLAIGDEEITPDRFYSFNSVALAPDFSRIAFSLSAYAMLTDLSLINVINLTDGRVWMMPEGTFGQVGEMVWSPTGRHLAYSLHTARAMGDRLSVDNIANLTKEFVLTDQEIVLGLRTEGTSDWEELNPNFRELVWSEDGQRLYFLTDSLIQDKTAKWSIKFNGTDLVLEEQIDELTEEITGHLIINNPGLEEDVWYLSHEAPGSPGLLTKLEGGDTIICSGPDYFCQGMADRNNDLNGARVEITGIEQDNLFLVQQIKLID